MFLLHHNRPMVSVADTLRIWMKEQGLSINALARLAKVPPSTLHRIVSDDAVDPRRTTLEKIARAFGKSVDDLYGEMPLDSPSEALRNRHNELAAILDTLTDAQLDAILQVARQLQKSV